ncbi:ATP-binding protein [Candidatus Amesbacteria bacterium]|nr:ATP-binding protein [Candidatus Amesbacteria bacterium]
MHLLKRQIEVDIDQYLQSEDIKILFVWGPRRSGKTTIINKLTQELGVKKYNFDLLSDREKFVPRREILEAIVQENKVILIDEVQSFPEATIILKILFDEFKVKIIATGSSELRQKSAREFDTLAGRFNEIYCLPLSISEVWENEKPKTSEMNIFTKKLAKNFQIYGAYPEVFLKEGKIDLLQHILDAYVLKDVKNTKLAKDILTKIALQLGSEVSVREIATSLGAAPSTVANYIEIFVKNYILISLPSFKTNTRKAVSENRKLYFYDLGIRNTEFRQDKGGVFENFIVSELEKMRKIKNEKINMYFYREYGGKEIDIIIEDYKKNYTTIEIKSKRGAAQEIFPLPNKSEIITAENYFEKICETKP